MSCITYRAPFCDNKEEFDGYVTLRGIIYTLGDKKICGLTQTERCILTLNNIYAYKKKTFYGCQIPFSKPNTDKSNIAIIFVPLHVIKNINKYIF